MLNDPRHPLRRTNPIAEALNRVRDLESLLLRGKREGRSPDYLRELELRHDAAVLELELARSRAGGTDASPR